MVHHIISNEDIKEIRKLFFEFDKDGDGRLSKDEIINGFKAQNNLDEKYFKKIFDQIDEDNSGYIEFEEFVRATINKTKLLCDDNLNITFKLFDKDGGGSITPDEIRSILGLSAKFSEEAWKEIIDTLEQNKQTEVVKFLLFRSLIKNLT